MDWVLGSYFITQKKKQVGLQRPNTAYLRIPSFFKMPTLPLKTKAVSIRNSSIKIEKSQALLFSQKVKKLEKTRSFNKFLLAESVSDF
jgi:hypothetical protein